MIRIFLVLFASLIFSSCTATANNAVTAQVRYTIIPEAPRPGDPITIGINSYAKEVLLFVNEKQAAKALCFSIPAEYSGELERSRAPRRNSRLSERQPGFMAAIITIPTTIEAEVATIIINNEAGLLCEIPITITPREFHSETLRLTPALSSLATDPNPQRTAESRRLWEILSTTGNQVYHTGPFVLPVTSTRRTSQFASRRINQYPNGRTTTSIHAGVDFGIPTGTPVVACGAGKVVLARMRIISGYSVIIEHAPGVYSIYYHLDSVSVQEDTIVEAGELIGLSGSTGFSTGPHLHWELRVSTENTDPDAFISRPIIDKELIISRIYN